MAVLAATLWPRIQALAHELGFAEIGVADIALQAHEEYLKRWLDNNYHAQMHYMKRHGMRRARPAELVPETISVISVRMNYLPPAAMPAAQVLAQSEFAYLSRYALGRDYHKLMRHRLKQLAQHIEDLHGKFSYRVFSDTAPVLEKALANKAGLGWIGKHSNLIAHDAGSFFFLGEIYTDLPLPVSTPATAHCGSCSACLECCPTQAIRAPFIVDANRCISYLTIEHPNAIPVTLRPLLGNRIYGCDDCQLVCPWNRFACRTQEPDFHVRQHLDAPRLLDLFAWTENEFMQRLEGSAIRRIGYIRWLRNIAVALGNAAPHPTIISALQKHLSHPSPLVREHITWALQQQNGEIQDV